jgi:hypothetical protein
MPVSGYLSNFSLPEILQFLDEGSKSGLLTVQSLPTENESPVNYFIWCNQGRIIAASDQQDYRGLVRLITRRKWLNDTQLDRLIRQCPPDVPLGLHLKSQDLLSVEQIKILFSVQAIRQICALFELTDGWFHFLSNVQLPFLEMTGTSIPAKEVTLPGLRFLRDWSALEEKLPVATSGLTSKVNTTPNFKLNQQEWQIWEFVNSTVTLTEMAEHLSLSLEAAQRIAFRLIVIGLVEEVPLILETFSKKDTDRSIDIDMPDSAGLSHAFFNTLSSYLKKQV